MPDDLHQRIAEAERRLRYATTFQERRSASDDLDDLNAIKLSNAQRDADAANHARLAELGIAPEPVKPDPARPEFRAV
jgi:hypothetical protein